ncbi:toxin Cry1Ac domain D-VI-related protein [Listeria newyorkensis]|uniref:Carbohydrate binding domain-containing protein n=1 Tax=Listeria newyorkensis TaxID=1497681 RepID=A0A841YXU7_9LIST|nr:toxin Cry1Ac domain D-VI-related protein [Listeria newyorkensis]MBC1457762.1 hypothetical protein [Listeria newyorkensis]
MLKKDLGKKVVSSTAIAALLLSSVSAPVSVLAASGNTNEVVATSVATNYNIIKNGNLKIIGYSISDWKSSASVLDGSITYQNNRVPTQITDGWHESLTVPYNPVAYAYRELNEGENRGITMKVEDHAAHIPLENRRGSMTIRQDLTDLIPGKEYILTFKTRKESSGSLGKVTVGKDSDWWGEGQITTSSATNFIKHTQKITFPGTTDGLQISLSDGTNQPMFSIANIELVPADKYEEEKEAQTAVNELFVNNNPANNIKDTITQADIDNAQAKIDVLQDATKKAALQEQLDKAQAELNAKKEATAKEEAAQTAINELFVDNNPANKIKDTVTQADIDNAQSKINAVTDPAKKAELQAQLDKAQYELNAKTDAAAKEAAAKTAVNELFVSNNPANKIKDTTTQAHIDAAQAKVNAVKDAATKATLQAQVDKAQNELNAKIDAAAKEAAAKTAVNELFVSNNPANKIKDTTTQAHIDAAQAKVNAVKDAATKAVLQAQVDKAQTELNAKIDAAAKEAAAKTAVNELFVSNNPVNKIKDTTTQAHIDAAQAKVNAVKDAATKAALQAQVDKAQTELNAKTDAAAKEAAAKTAVNELFVSNNPANKIKDTTTQAHIDAAQAKVNAVTDAATKATLQAQVDKAQAELNAKKEAEAKEAAARTAINELFVGNNPANSIKDTTTQANIDAAQAKINEVTDATKKAALQKDLDEAKKQLASKKAEDAVNALFTDATHTAIKTTTDQSAIDAAQAVINKVTDTAKKVQLQAELNKAQELFDAKNNNQEAIKSAQKAIQDLMTSLISFGQKTDLYGAIKLDTTQDMIYQAQDLLSLIPDTAVEKASLEAQLAKTQDLLMARNNEQIGNKISNGNFDSALNGWKTWVGTGSVAPTVAAKEGVASNAVKLASNSSIEQTIQGLKPNTNYVLTFYGKVDDGTFLSAGIKNHGGAQQSIRITSSDYTKGQISFTTGASAKSATFFLMKGVGTGNGFADFIIAKADNGEDLIPEVIEATKKVENLFTNLSVIGVDESKATLYKNSALKVTVKQANIDAAMAIVNDMQDSYESKADLLAMLQVAQNYLDERATEQDGNLVKNGEFDTSIANWKPWNSATSTAPTVISEDGNNVLKLAPSSSVEQVITGLQPNTTYTLEIYGKADNSGYVSVGIKNYGGAQKTGRVSGADYTKASITIRTGATNKTATVFLMKGAGTSTGMVDAVVFKDSTPESERPEVIAATSALEALFTSKTSVSTDYLTPVTIGNGAIKMTATEEELAMATAAVAAVPAGLKSKATFEAELARVTTLFDELKAAQTTNLTKNGMFDMAMTNWKTWKATAAETPVVVTEGSNKVVKLEGNSSVEQTISGLLPNTTYTVSTYGKVENGARLSLGVKSYGGTQANVFVTSTDYSQGTLTFTTGATNTSAVIFLSQGVAGGIAYADVIVTK